MDLVAGNYCIGDVARIENVEKVTLTGSQGAALVKSANAAPSNTALLQLVNTNRFHIDCLRMKADFSSTDASTGSNPGILVGEIAPSADGNANIQTCITNCNMEGFNWSAIMIYGARNAFSGNSQANIGFQVYKNDISNSSNGVFVYKNACLGDIYQNTIYDMYQDCIAIDTRAASDTQPSLPIGQISIYKNDLYGFGKSAQGIGVLFKGAIEGSDITQNKIHDASTLNALNNYAILVGPDFGGLQPRNNCIEKNDINGIYAASGRQGMGILVNQSINITTRKNRIKDTATFGAYYEKSSGEFIENFVESAGLNAPTATTSTPYAVRLEGDNNNYIDELRVGFNEIIKGAADPSVNVGLYQAFINDLRKASERNLSGFPTPEVIAAVNNQLPY